MTEQYDDSMRKQESPPLGYPCPDVSAVALAKAIIDDLNHRMPGWKGPQGSPGPALLGKSTVRATAFSFVHFLTKR